MWLFNRSNAAESDSSIKEVTHAQRQRNKQIEWLREKINGITEVERDKKYQVIFTVYQKPVTLDITLSERFPFEAPLVTASPFFIHPWVDQQMVVVGSPLLNQFNPHCNLGEVVQQIIDEITNYPPQFDITHNMATQPLQMYPPSQISHIPYHHGNPAATGGVGGSLLDTPFSFSSAPQPIHFSQTANIDASPPLRSVSSPLPTNITPSNVPNANTAGGDLYSAPETLPGLSEKPDEQLNKYLKDEDAVVMIDRYISRLEVISKVQQEMEKLFIKNEEQSRENIDMEPELQRRWERLQEKYLELQNYKEGFDCLYQKQIQLLKKYDRKQVSSTLKTNCQEADTNSEILAEDFLDQKMDSSSFIQKYLQERKLYHLRSIKTEMLRHNRT